MNKLRERAGFVLFLLVFAFGVIWALQDSGLFNAVGAVQVGKTIVVNGTPISVQEYQDRVSQESQRLSQENPDGGASLQDAAEQQAFEGVVMDKLIEAEMDRFGLVVSDDEVREMIYGANPHPVVRQYLGDEQGNVDPAALQQARQQQPQAFLQLEDYLRAVRRQEKFQTLLHSLVRVSDAEARQILAFQRDSVRVDVVGLRASAVPDAQVQMTEAKARAYYDAHPKDYERKKTLRVQFVSIPKTPSAADSAQALQDFQELRTQFQASTDDSAFVAGQGSERPYTGQFQTPAALGPVATLVYAGGTPTAGQVLGPQIVNGEVVLAKVQAVRPSAQEFIHARHILLTAPEGDAAARGQARTRLEQIKAQITGGASFEALARQHSQDPGSGAQGGDLGWFGRGQMVPPFEAAAFGAAPGSLVGPVETSFGVHLIQVLGKTNQEARVAVFTQRFRPNDETLRQAEDQIADFLDFTEGADSTKVAAEVQRLGLRSSVQTVTEDQTTYPEIGASGRLGLFLKTAEAGDVSDQIELDDRFLVARVLGVTPAGVRPFEEVRQEVTTKATLAAKLDAQAERLRTALAQGFDGLGARVGAPPVAATLRAQSGFEVPGFGPQPTLGGAVFNLAPGTTSPVVRGQDAVFVARVVSAGRAPLTAAELAQVRDGLAQSRRQQIVQRFLQGLRESATVEDNRAAILR